MRYATGIGERGRPIDVRDPLLKSFQEKLHGAGRDGYLLAFSNNAFAPGPI
jgi:hypothetical protein